MKKLFLFFSMVLFYMAAVAQSPTKADYQMLERVAGLFDSVTIAIQANNTTQIKELCAVIDPILLQLPSKFAQATKYYKAMSAYSLACAYAIEKSNKAALDYFEKAVQLGFNSYSEASTVTYFDPIRNEKRFVKAMESLRLAGDFIYILQQAAPYKREDITNYPKFSYGTPQNPGLEMVRDYFKLDSIAGDGDEIYRFKNVMSWVHNNVKYDGAHWAFSSQNAIDMYNYVKASDKGINCRNLAVMLNELYLSLGYKSRYVVCEPKDREDMDCHVITVVYSETLDKWIWMDPTYNAYLEDENGVLLSIADVRQRLIDNAPIILNSDANWNNIIPRTKQEYIDGYMAKNLYWIQTPTNSTFNIETLFDENNIQYICLVPPGFVAPQWGNYFVTSDDEYFWQKPQ